MEINLASRRILSSLPLGVPPDLQSGVKKCPNLFGLCGFAIRSKGVFLFLFYLFQFLLKSSSIHFARYGQTKREGYPDAQQAHAAWKTEGISQRQ